MKKKLILFIPLFWICVEAKSQRSSCGHGDLSHYSLPTHAGKYTLPLVVHVWGNIYLSSTPSDAQSAGYGSLLTDGMIKEVIAETNALFQGKIYGREEVFPAFQSVKQDINLEFKLAKKDPDGNLTNGIIHHPPFSKGQIFTSRDEIDKAANKVGWDNSKYVNIHIVANPELNLGGTSNYAYPPWVNKDWVVMSSSVFKEDEFYRKKSRPQRQKASLASAVIAHELGHYLGLLHTFGLTNAGDCQVEPRSSCLLDGDMVMDTPREEGNPGTTNGLLQWVRQKGLGLKNCRGEVVNVENIMGYYLTLGKGKMFTAGQVRRMRKTLENFPKRRNLWQIQNLNATGVPHTKTASILPETVYKVYEESENDGTLRKRIVISLKHARFKPLSAGETTYKYNIIPLPSPASTGRQAALPAGITLSISPFVGDPTKAILTITGKANAHNKADNGHVVIQLPANQVTLGRGVMGFENQLAIHFHFLDPYSVKLASFSIGRTGELKVGEVYKIIEDNFITSLLKSPRFARFSEYIFMKNKTKLRLYKFGAMVCEPNTRNISLLSKGTMISSQSHWSEGTSLLRPARRNIGRLNANQKTLLVDRALDYTLISPQYKAWEGVKDGYTGFSFLKGGEDGRPMTRHYGWLRFEKRKVNNTELTYYQYAYNTQPNAPIVVGEGSISIPIISSKVYTLGSLEHFSMDLIQLQYVTKPQLEKAPKGMHLKGNQITWTPQDNQIGAHKVVLSAMHKRANSRVSTSLVFHVVKKIAQGSVVLIGHEVHSQSRPGALVGKLVTHGDPQVDPSIRHELIGATIGGHESDLLSFTIQGNELRVADAASFDPAMQPYYHIRVRTSNEVSHWTSRFTIRVAQGEHLPTWKPIPPTTVNELEKVDLNLANYVSGSNLTYRLGNPLYGVKLDGITGRMTWTPAEFQGPKSYNIIVLATPFGTPYTARQNVQITVRSVNTPPKFLSVANKTAIVGTPSVFMVIAKDPDYPKQPLTFALDQPAIDRGMTLRPAGDYVYVFWTPDKSAEGTHQVTMTATDSQGATTNATFSVSVEAKNLLPTSIQLSHYTVTASSPPQTFIGKLTTVDENSNDEHLYQLGADDESTHFMIRQDSLFTSGKSLLQDVYIISVTAVDRKFKGTTRTEYTEELPIEVIPPAQVLGVNDLKSDISIFPVPTSGRLNLRLSQPLQGQVRIKLRNLSGQQVAAWTKTNATAGEAWETAIDLSHLPNGVYMMEVIANRQRWMKKVVKHEK